MKSLWIVLLLLACAGPVRAEEYKVESVGALTETSVADAVRKSLDEKGIRVVGPGGKAVCELWLRKDVPTTKDEVAGASFGQIAEGTLVGVVRFPANTSDYRGQGIKAGYYTLRYALILQDGNHLGVSPARDFLLLCPAAEDKDPAAQIKSDQLLKWSRTASGTGHPSPWCLVLPSSDKDLPKISRNEHEHIILEFKLAAAGGPLAIGLVVVGRTEG